MNMGFDNWALPVHMLEYGGNEMLSINSVYPAVLDTGNTTITLPEEFFDKFFDEMKKDESSLYIEESRDEKVMKSRKPCHKIEDNL